MTQPYSGFQGGGVVQPLSTTSLATDLQIADPAVFYALDFFSYVIQTYPGPRMLQAAQRAGIPPTFQVVAQRYPYLLSEADFQTDQVHFPLLMMGRTRTLTGRKTASWEHDRGMFELVYVLPPGLRPDQKEYLVPYLHAIAQALQDKATQSYDPGYTPPGGSLGQSPWGLAFAAVENIGFGDPYRDFVESTNYAYLDAFGNTLAPCIRMFGYLTERTMYNKAAMGAVTFTGADITADLRAPDGTVIHPFVQASTNVAPTLTSLSVTSGTHSGGTTTILNGSGFVNGASYGVSQLQVLFGTVPAASVQWLSATQVQVVTPAVSGASAYPVGVLITNPDGQSALLNSAFLFT